MPLSVEQISRTPSRYAISGMIDGAADDLMREFKSALQTMGLPIKDIESPELKRALERLEKENNRLKLGGAGLDLSDYRVETKGARRLYGLGTPEGKSLDAFLRNGEVKTASPEGLETKALQAIVGVDSAGGYTASEELATEIYSVGGEQGVIRGLARIEKPKTGDFHIPIAKTRVGAAHVGETTDREETTTPDFAKMHPTYGGLAAVVPVGNWLLSDSDYDLGRFVIDSIGEQFGETEGADFVNGNGVNKSTGFLTATTSTAADATRTFGEVQYHPSGSATDLDIDDLIDLRSKLAPRYRKGASWVMHPDTETYIRKLKSAATGEYYWQPAVREGAPNTLLGNPCFTDVNMPTIAANALAVAIADWRRFYVVADIGQMVLLRDSVTKKGYTLFYAEKRLGGSILDSNAGKFLKVATT